MPIRTAILAALATALLAEIIPEYQAGMKAADRILTALQKAETKTGPQAVRAAERLGAIYEDLVGFWRQRGARDAVKWSQEGKALSLRLTAAAHAGNAAEATAALEALSRNCQTCHEAHRAKLPDGRFSFR